ncbi:DNA-binding transcriptional MerR regulator [Sphaerotilus sulfidivorans]|jgi:DNA-binding transcriptional MerR regulator|uniref:DNA-binding transcriptional MerR regulator n=2 Tax=Sphaerotilus TaxID=34102 RepID=A0A5C1PWL0_9BURK|nr:MULTISPECIES: MerR family transcriptional regulator [Sphaerotilaceae]NRT55702.1 DNA-binding transcriptional MerR regulator [Leptothrix sp. C29]NZD46930.1 MerR family transcriptional regulator [Sphaerotilus sulfidivorans]QEM99776.1 MerR family transcriptional regulator [Sphaerotilus sulfidivorans]GKQ58029.1 hypothetical protein QMTAC487_18890 [Sphaerotilus sp. FB-3]
MTTTPDAAGHTLAELCALVDLPARTVRYYVQLGLVDRPVGETRAARYGARHLEQLLQIRRWSAAGLSLERIRELLHGETPELPARAPSPGTVTVCSHLTVADGVALVIDPGRAGVSSEQLRVFVRAVMAAWDEALGPIGAGAQPPP